MNQTTVPVTPRPYTYNNLSRTPGGIPALQQLANGGCMAPVTAAFIHPADLQHVIVPVTSADLLTAFTAGISVLAAPTNYVELTTNIVNVLNGTTTGVDAVVTPTILLERVYARMIAGATAYTAGGPMSFVYHGTSVTNMNTLAAACITATASTQVNYIVQQLATATGTNLTTGAGLGIDIVVAGQNFATGNGILLLDFWYQLR